jgi:hypothetical protein
MPGFHWRTVNALPISAISIELSQGHRYQVRVLYLEPHFAKSALEFTILPTAQLSRVPEYTPDSNRDGRQETNQLVVMDQDAHRVRSGHTPFN